MKQCHTCGESFNDKFVFCPIDGTALNGAGAPAGEPFAAEEPSLFAGGQQTAQQTVVAADAPPQTKARAEWVEEQTPTTAAAAARSLFNVSAATSPGNGSADPEETVVAAPAPVEREEYYPKIFEDMGLTKRLTKESRGVVKQPELMWPELLKEEGESPETQPTRLQPNSASHEDDRRENIKHVKFYVWQIVLLLLHNAFLLVVLGLHKLMEKVL